MPSPDDATSGGVSYNGSNGHYYDSHHHHHLDGAGGEVHMISGEHAEDHHHHEDNGHLECEERKNGRNRPRKRKLYGEICKQMEFYFSDANITKNRMMREIVEEANEKSDGFVDLCVFLDFTKIQRLAANQTHIKKALVASEKLELSSDGEKVRRKVPFDAGKLKSEAAVEECTIYVENIPRDSDHEWVEKIFQAFGPVAYISLPKFKSGQHKGFAFVEFDDEDAARRCLEAYGEEGACLPNDIDPAELRSIQSFNEEQASATPSSKTPEGDTSSKNSSKEVAKQKRKGGQTDNEPEIKKKKQDEPNLAPSPSSSEEETEMKTDGETTSKKRKRKKNKTKKTVEAKLESESIMLKVLPKKSWRQLRNRYLNLQRSNMSKLKRQLQQQYLREQHFKNFYQPPTSQQQQEKTGGTHSHSDHGFNGDQEQKMHDPVMEIKMKKPAESVDCFRHKISIELAEQDEDEALISGFIKFIDYKQDDVHAYVRVNGDESFSARGANLLKKCQEAFVSARYLSAKEVDEYKSRVQAELKKKQKEQPRKNIRGKDRLMKAATKSTHIRFDDENDEREEMEQTEVIVK